MRSHVTKTVSACFVVLRQLRSIRCSVPRSVLQSLVTSLVLSRLDYGNAVLAGIPLYLVTQLQSVTSHTLTTNFASRRISTPDDVCALLRRHHSSSDALVGPPLAIEHSRSPAPVFGTVGHSTSAPSLSVFRSRLKTHCFQ